MGSINKKDHYHEEYTIYYQMDYQDPTLGMYVVYNTT